MNHHIFKLIALIVVASVIIGFAIFRVASKPKKPTATPPSQDTQTKQEPTPAQPGQSATVSPPSKQPSTEPSGIADRYGVFMDWPDENSAPKIYKLMSEARLKWSREGLSRQHVHLGLGEFDWSSTDFTINQASLNGFNILGQVGGTPDWDTTGPTESEQSWTYPPKSYDQWGEFIYQIVSRYKNKVHFWEIWNEPDFQVPQGEWGGTPQEFARLLAVAHDQVKRADPNAKVVIAGMIGGSGSNDLYPESVEFIKAIIADSNYPARRYFDIMNIHVYGTRDQVRNQMAAWDRFLKELGIADKPVWVTEMGWSSLANLQSADQDFCCGPQAQAKYLKTIMPELVELGAEKVFWFASWVADDFAYAEFRGYGLLDSKLQPKPAYENLKQLLSGP